MSYKQQLTNSGGEPSNYLNFEVVMNVNTSWMREVCHCSHFIGEGMEL